MNIGFDAKRIVRNGTGLGSYGRTLMNSLSVMDSDDALFLYAPDAGRDELRNQIEPRPHVRFVYPTHLHFRIQRDLWRSKGIVKDLLRDKIQVFHGLSGELPKGLKASGIKGVVTVHDLIFFRHPEYYHWIDVQLYKRKFYQTLKEADRIIAISECTKRDILHYGDFPENRIDVIYQSCSTRFKTVVTEQQRQKIKEKYGLPEKYILNVGTIEKRKNVLLAVKALLSLPEDLHLVIVGRATVYQKEIDAFVEKYHLQERIQYLTGVPNEDLYAIYQQAACFVYPSRYEGFGIPIIEAIQSGLPVVAATGSCLEEAGGPDCLYVDPDDVESMAKAIVQVMKEKEQRVPKCQAYIMRFENSDIAAQMLSEYVRV